LDSKFCLDGRQLLSAKEFWSFILLSPSSFLILLCTKQMREFEKGIIKKKRAFLVLCTLPFIAPRQNLNYSFGMQS
jgi:hypothetical protein